MTHITSLPAGLQPLLGLTERVGLDPLLTQGSTGNSSIKLDGVIWVKASGRWMMDALRDDIFIPLDLDELRECLHRARDPKECHPEASVETALHATLPHRVVLHVHCVNTIAWAVREDAEKELARRLDGLRWRWIPYVESGIPLARALAAQPDANIFVLGNHGLVVGGEDANTVHELLRELSARLEIPAREAHPADYAALVDLAENSPWDLPEDDGVHALATDPVAQKILAAGLLYPCQALFSGFRTPEPFCPIEFPETCDDWQERFRHRPYLVVRGRGVLVSRSISGGELAMITGLAEVVQRIGASAPLRYLSDTEITKICTQTSYRYLARTS